MAISIVKSIFYVNGMSNIKSDPSRSLIRVSNAGDVFDSVEVLTMVTNFLLIQIRFI